MKQKTRQSKVKILAKQLKQILEHLGIAVTSNHSGQEFFGFYRHDVFTFLSESGEKRDKSKFDQPLKEAVPL